MEGEGEVLTPNVIMIAFPEEDIEYDKDKLAKMSKRLEDAKAFACKRWKWEYVHSLMEIDRLNKEVGATPEVGVVVLVVEDETNHGERTKGKVLRLIRGKDGVVRGLTQGTHH